MSREWFDADRIGQAAEVADRISRLLKSARDATKQLPDQMLFCELATFEHLLPDLLLKAQKLKGIADTAGDPLTSKAQRTEGALKAKKLRLEEKSKRKGA
jgi:hypothetical protein